MQTGYRTLTTVAAATADQIVEEFRSDLGPISKAIDLSEQASKQVGEWVEKHQQVETSPEAIVLTEIFTIEELKTARERLRARSAAKVESGGTGPSVPVLPN
jgi:hypothetical protein